MSRHSHLKQNIQRIGESLGVYRKGAEALLETILKFDVHRDLKKGLNAFDFFQTFFHSSENVQKSLDKLIENINLGVMFHVIHSYGKNGKSTFLKFLEHNLQKIERIQSRELSLYNFDFRLIEQTKVQDQNTYKNKVVIFFKRYILTTYSEDYENGCKKLYEFISHYEGIINKSRKNNGYDYYDEITEEYSQFLEDFIEDLQVAILEINRQNDLTNKEIKRKLFAKIDSIFNNEERVYQPGILLCFLIHWIVFERKQIFVNNSNKESYKRNKLIILFDNIDDVYSDVVTEIAEDHIFNIAKYVSMLEISDLDKDLRGFSADTDLVFIYSMRTANFINAYKSFVQNPQLRADRSDILEHSFRKYKLSSVKTSFEIVEKRLQIFDTIADHFSISPGPSRIFLNHLMVSLRSFEFNALFHDHDINNIFRLFNGNRTPIYYISKHTYLDEYNTVFNKISGRHTFLSKSALIFLFLKLLGNSQPHQSLNSIVEYLFNSFEEEVNKGRCSIKRLFLNFLINSSEVNREINNFIDIDKKGVGLFDILMAFEELNALHPAAPPYPKEDIKNFFSLLFHEQIDAWGHLLTCTKLLSDIKQDKNTVKRIDLSPEIEIFFEKVKSGYESIEAQNCKKELNQIRFFYNDNAYYIAKHILYNFEYFSISNKTSYTKKPLLLSAKLLGQRQDKSYEFEFEQLISSVFQRVKECLTTTVEFYESILSKKYTPEEFLSNSLFVMNKRFFYVDVITKHISYLNEFRLAIFTSEITVEYNVDKREEILHQANIILTKTINEYLMLYFELNQRMNKYHQSSQEEYSLHNTDYAMEYLKEVVDSILRGSSGNEFMSIQLNPL